MTDRATLTTRLADAESALHALQIGGAEIQVRGADGRMIIYQPGDTAKLQRYISQLQRQLGIHVPGRQGGYFAAGG